MINGILAEISLRKDQNSGPRKSLNTLQLFCPAYGVVQGEDCTYHEIQRQNTRHLDHVPPGLCSLEYITQGDVCCTPQSFCKIWFPIAGASASRDSGPPTLDVAKFWYHCCAHIHLLEELRDDKARHDRDNSVVVYTQGERLEWQRDLRRGNH